MIAMIGTSDQPWCLVETSPSAADPHPHQLEGPTAVCRVPRAVGSSGPCPGGSGPGTPRLPLPLHPGAADHTHCETPDQAAACGLTHLCAGRCFLRNPGTGSGLHLFCAGLFGVCSADGLSQCTCTLHAAIVCAIQGKLFFVSEMHWQVYVVRLHLACRFPKYLALETSSPLFLFFVSSSLLLLLLILITIAIIMMTRSAITTTLLSRLMWEFQSTSHTV